jgi:hypothetical protein
MRVKRHSLQFGSFRDRCEPDAGALSGARVTTDRQTAFITVTRYLIEENLPILGTMHSFEIFSHSHTFLMLVHYWSRRLTTGVKVSAWDESDEGPDGLMA